MLHAQSSWTIMKWSSYVMQKKKKVLSSEISKPKESDSNFFFNNQILFVYEMKFDNSFII